MAAERIRTRATVRGRVQGVGFRMSARDEARRLGLAGVARNLADGSVEVEVEGEEPAVAALLDWLQSGPSWARVDSVDVTEQRPTGKSGFQVE